MAFVEVAPTACATLRRNLREWPVIEGDVGGVDFSKFLGEVDVVSGEPPCQTFSYAGKRFGFRDTRGTLFSQFARCLQEVRPKVFLV